ncbi:glycoside hydrolase [Aureobasidium pullulans]|nr:glycoside hydrolase [Aureobasidium pullulans]
MKFFSAAAALLAAVPFTNAYWKGFNIAANNPDGSCKTQAQWASAFQKLSSLPGHFTSVRLYASSDCNTLALAVPAALSTGTQLLVGVWAEDAAHFKAEKDALESAIKRYGQDWIIAISVGSEDLYRKDTNPGALAQKIYDVRGMVRAMGVKKEVGHVDTWTAWVDGANTEVIKASDFIGLGNVKNAQTFWKQVACAAFKQIHIFWYVHQDYQESPSFGVIDRNGKAIYDILNC